MVDSIEHGSSSSPSRRRRARGAAYVEVLVIVGVVLTLGLVGLTVLGGAFGSQGEREADCIRSFSCTGAKRRASGLAPVRAAFLSGLPAGATHTRIASEVFIRGDGDKHAIDPSDVGQGALGDCFLMASLAALARTNPKVIERAIRSHGDGTHTVRFYEKREGWFGNRYKPVYVQVTDALAMSDRILQFADIGDRKGGKNEIWAALIEKAYAQWKGGYDVLDQGGFSADALEELTGEDSARQVTWRQRDYRRHITHDELYLETIVDKFQRGWAVTPSTPSDTDMPLIRNNTLVAGHGYFMTAVDTEKRTITVRNPWGWHTKDVTMTYEEFVLHFPDAAWNPTK